jgi:hypothetical protein
MAMYTLIRQEATTSIVMRRQVRFLFTDTVPYHGYKDNEMMRCGFKLKNLYRSMIIVNSTNEKLQVIRLVMLHRTLSQLLQLRNTE